MKCEPKSGLSCRRQVDEHMKDDNIMQKNITNYVPITIASWLTYTMANKAYFRFANVIKINTNIFRNIWKVAGLW